MIVFFYDTGEKLKIVRKADIEEFKAAANSDNPKAQFHIGKAVFLYRRVKYFIPYERRGPYAVRRESHIF